MIKTLLVLIFVFFLHRFDVGKPVFARKNKADRSVTIFHEHGALLDSLQIPHVSFLFDSLSQINDSLWSYKYVVGDDDSTIVFSKQMIIQIINNKLHVCYINSYLNKSLSFDFGFRYKSDFSVGARSYQVACERLKWDQNEDGLKVDSSRFVVPLMFDTVNKIFFSDTKILNGEYLYKESQKAKITKVFIDSMPVKTIDLDNNGGFSFYYNGKWMYHKRLPIQVLITPFFEF